MKIKVYFTKEEFQKWKRGEEVRLNNLPESKEEQKTGVEVKMEAYIHEKELIDIEKETIPYEIGNKKTIYWYTVKRENGPIGRLL